ncbi:MAG TPA: T9SS type A sorting domain-containing protein, partial [Saprospiraceae bacterium]|nr:T9SS type A sorting domain-containing protein [Saprospiraceae bacterium]
MKRLIPIATLLLLSTWVIKGQVTVTVDPPSFVMTGTPSQTDINFHVHVTNTSAQTANILWSRRVSGGPANWITWVCDKNLCYDPSYTSCPVDQPCIMGPGEIMDLQMHLLPLGTEGTADYDVNLFDSEGNQIASIDGQAIVSLSSAVKDPGDAKLTIFPNPTEDYFQITDLSGLRYIEVFNLVGNKVKSFDAAPARQYYVGDLNEGIYLVRLMNSSKKILKTVRLSIR